MAVETSVDYMDEALAPFRDASGRVATTDFSNLIVSLYEYSMNQTSAGGCVTCDVVGYFIVALMRFSLALYDALLPFFTAFAPVMMLIWIAWHMSILMTKGGAGGYDAIFAVIRKLVLMGFIYLLMTPPGGAKYFAWESTGTMPVTYALGFSHHVKTELGSHLPGRRIPDCTREPSSDLTGSLSSAVSGMPTTPPTEAMGKLLAAVNATTCTIERAHIGGVVTGMAVMTAPVAGQGWDVVAGFVTALMRVIVGVFIMGVWGISVVWYVFSIVDIMFKALVISGFMPMIALAYLFNISRSQAVSALRSLLGAVFQAATIALTIGLTAFLVTMVVPVYEAAIGRLRPILAGSESDNPGFMPIISTAHDPMASFLAGISTGNIPSDIMSPWMIYMIMSSLISLFAGKKMVQILSSVTGLESDSEMTIAGGAAKMAAGGATIAGGLAAGSALIGGRLGSGGARGLASGFGYGTSSLEKASGATKAGFAAGQALSSKVLNPFFGRLAGKGAATE